MFQNPKKCSEIEKNVLEQCFGTFDFFSKMMIFFRNGPILETPNGPNGRSDFYPTAGRLVDKTSRQL